MREVGAGCYESWVLRLRRWRDDPSVTLEDLPTLDEATFTPATYTRFLKHVAEALATVDERWAQAASATFATSGDMHSLGRELVRLRTVLAARLAISSHPGLPEGIRDALRAADKRAIQGYQRQLEELVRRDEGRGRVAGSQLDEMVRLVRTNSMERILDRAPAPDGAVPDAPRVVPESAGSTNPASRRRVVLPPARSPRAAGSA